MLVALVCALFASVSVITVAALVYAHKERMMGPRGERLRILQQAERVENVTFDREAAFKHARFLRENLPTDDPKDTP